MIHYALINIPEDLSEVVRAERQEQGLSQAELAQRSGCSQRLISEFERGKQTVEFGKVLQLIHALGLSFGVTSAKTAQENERVVYDTIRGIERTILSKSKSKRKLVDYL